MSDKGRPPFEQKAEGTGAPIRIEVPRRPPIDRMRIRDPLVLDLKLLEDGTPIVLTGLDTAAREQGLVFRMVGWKLIVDRATDVEYLDEVAKVVSLTPMTAIQKRARILRHARGLELVQRLEQAFGAFREEFRGRMVGAPEGEPAADCLLLEDGKVLPYAPMTPEEAFQVKRRMEFAYQNKSFRVVREVQR